MNEQTIRQLGEDIGRLVAEYGLEMPKYTLSIYISRDNYLLAKEHFANLIPENDEQSGVFVEGTGWEIYLLWKHW
jgi:hypothetical protein